MRARDVVGKIVAEVVQTRVKDGGAMVWTVDGLRFTDGSYLSFLGSDARGEDGGIVTATFYNQRRQRNDGGRSDG